MELPVDHPSLTDGWHVPEREGMRLWRWTDGDAVLPVPPGATLLEIQVIGTAEYEVGPGAGSDPLEEAA